MDTYVLVGDPGKKDGMNKALWNQQCAEVAQGGSALTSWFMTTKNAPPGSQIVVIRTGQVRGVIGFGHLDDSPKVFDRGHIEYPIRLMNMRSIDEAPFMTRAEMEAEGAWRRDRNGGFTNYFGSGSRLLAERKAVEACCEKMLGFSLATLCSTRLVGPGIPGDAFNNPVREAEDIAAIKQRTDLPATMKKQLIDARRGQGNFREKVRAQEPFCRVTHVSAPEHLRASHMKPWRECSDAERLDANNGLMLAPHIDHLFDQGYITFGSDGSLMTSDKLDHAVMDSWNLAMGSDPKPLSPLQEHYMSFHRTKVFGKVKRR
jgi:HNH endonuclease